MNPPTKINKGLSSQLCCYTDHGTEYSEYPQYKCDQGFNSCQKGWDHQWFTTPTWNRDPRYLLSDMYIMRLTRSLTGLSSMSLIIRVLLCGLTWNKPRDSYVILYFLTFLVIFMLDHNLNAMFYQKKKQGSKISGGIDALAWYVTTILVVSTSGYSRSSQDKLWHYY